MRRRQSCLLRVATSLWLAVVTWTLPHGGYCRQIEHVRPVDWTRYAAMMGVRSNDAFGQTLATILQNEARYELRWVGAEQRLTNNLLGWDGVECFLPRFDAYNYECAVRPLTGFAYGMAAMLKTGIYSPGAGGLSRDEAMHRTELAIRGAAFTHIVNTPSDYHSHRWGQGAAQSWEAAYWCAQVAQAAWWLWGDLSPQTKGAVAKMVEHDADAFIGLTVPYWADKEGKIVTPGDTKAEENAWNSMLLATAQAMMPHHPNIEKWRQKASEYQISAYSRQSDLTNSAIVDGKTAKDWLNGFNVFEDGVLVNHNRVHPDYMLAQASCFASMVVVSLARQYIPPSMVFNAGLAYRALTEVQFTPGADTIYGTGKTIAAPGGTIYYRTADRGYSGDIYYPQGSDWTTKMTDGYLNMDLAATQLGFDSGKPFSAMGWAKAHAQALLALQYRAGHDGNIYQPGDWSAKYRGTDEVIFQSNAQAWMQWWLMQNHLMSPVGEHWGMVRGGQ
jgi:hypothetical protein